MDLDLRRLRYFVTVAEQSSFRGAAERLLIAQPALSRQVRALENELGTTLLRRTPRGVELTPSGEVVLEEARQLLDYSVALVRRVKAPPPDAGRSFTIGFRPGVGVAALARRFQSEHPGLVVGVSVTSARNQARVVRDGSVDVSLVRDPHAVDLVLLPLYCEPQVVCIAAEHPLAEQPRVGLDELTGLAVITPTAEVPRTPSASHPGRAGQEPLDDDVGPEAQIVERLEYVAAGQGILVVPCSVAGAFSRADVASLHVEGIPPSQVVLAHRRGNQDAALSSFTDLALAVLRTRVGAQHAAAASGDAGRVLDFPAATSDAGRVDHTRTGMRR